LASTSAIELAQVIIDDCLAYGTWPSRALDALLERALDEDDEFRARAATRALFSIVIEPLADSFEPELTDVYVRLFAHVIARALPDYDAAELVTRYNRIRQIRPFIGGETRRLCVLSRITLGADVAVTSVALNACKERFPDAEICFVGPEKNAALFAADERITPLAVTYGRAGSLRERLLAALELQTLVDEPNTLVIDPDSRLSQLGLIPICDDSRYFLFESRSYGGESDLDLPSLTASWLQEVFDVAPAHPYVAPLRQQRIADVTVSWGVGENQDKRINEYFEGEVLRALLDRELRVLLDRGAGGEEAARIDHLASQLGHPGRLILHDGSYASFASHILQSNLYVGYDSAGQHVASAGNVPLISIFAGFACQRMLARWRPKGPRAQIITSGGTDASEVLARTLHAISEAEVAAGPVTSKG
jgi:Glycosyltransferase family 9 (heptosyltransferase)